MASQFSLLDNFPTFALPALQTSGANVVDRLGMDVVKDVVLEVLTGRNIRDSTEILTRRRIATVNLGIVSLFLTALMREADFQNALIDAAKTVITSKRPSRDERHLAQWLVGLTDKSVQNVLRDDPDAIDRYVNSYIAVTNDVASQFQSQQDYLLSPLASDSSPEYPIDWNWMAHLTNTIGTSTLTIRGSEKSTFGKLFEKLILGSLLSVLGFQFHAKDSDSLSPGEFILSSRGARRESDATLLLGLGDAIRFDIGFIGRGNTEISLDKVTRFESEEYIAGSRTYIATIIIVDRIGPGSRIPELARNLGGHIVQMSGGYWPRTVAQLIDRVRNTHDELSDCPDSRIQDLLKERLDAVDISTFI